MYTRILRQIRSFLRDTSGTAAMETVILMPLLFWTYMALAVYFDAFKTRSATEKAAFTISDVLSRETSSIDEVYLAGVHNLFDFIAKSAEETSLRVSVVSYSTVNQAYALEWSEVDGDAEALTASDLLLMEESLPVMSNGENLILVETFSTYDPGGEWVVTGVKNFSTFIFTRPRFAPQLTWAS